MAHPSTVLLGLIIGFVASLGWVIYTDSNMHKKMKSDTENIIILHPHLTPVYEECMYDGYISKEEYELIQRLAIRGIDK